MANQIIKKTNIMTSTSKVKQSVYQSRPQVRGSQEENLYRTLANDGCEDFYNYIDWLDLAKNPNIIVLPVTSSFFYMPEDMKNTEAVINLKPLNLVNDTRAFIQKVYSFLPDYCFFTGCFEEGKNRKKTADKNNNQDSFNRLKIGKSKIKEIKYHAGWVAKMIKKLFTPGAKRHMTRKSTASMLKGAGFTVHDMTGLNNRTYFCAQKRPAADN